MKDELFKDRIGYIVGFVGLIISLNSFKEDLRGIVINIDFFTFNLAQYFLCIILGVVVGLQFFYLPQFIQLESKAWINIKSALRILSYSIFFIIASSPLILLFLFGIAKLFLFLSFIAKINHPEWLKNGLFIFSVVFMSIKIIKEAKKIDKLRRRRSEIDEIFKSLDEIMGIDTEETNRHREKLKARLDELFKNK